MKAAIIGLTGFNGTSLAKYLLERDHEVVGLARDPAKVTVDVPVVIGDAITGQGLEEALDGVDAAYYFVHAFDPGDSSSMDRDVRAAHKFAAAAQRTSLPRVVFFTTYEPPPGTRSAYLEDRLAVEPILLECTPRSVALRCGLVVGAGSRALRPIVQLIKRARVVPTGPWRKNTVGALDVSDVDRYLLAAAIEDVVGGRPYDLPAAEIVTQDRLYRMVADILGLRRTFLKVPFSSPKRTSAMAARITGESEEFMGALLSIVLADSVPRAGHVADFAPGELRPLEPSLRDAVLNWQDLPRYELARQRAGEHAAA